MNLEETAVKEEEITEEELMEQDPLADVDAGSSVNNTRSIGENYGCEEENNVDKRKRGSIIKYDLPYNIKAVNGRISSGEEDVKFWEENHNLKQMGVGKNIKLYETLYTPGCRA